MTASPARGAASLAASLASLLTTFAIESQGVKERSNVASVEKALSSFASSMASLAASPASEAERLTASVAASISKLLASFAQSLGTVR
jgi:hypothetical protein